jgi:alanyl-tRNA synthetase
MTSKEIRQAFLDFFQSKQHRIVPSAPMVVKNDPSLMFTNAGMNQFKDIFLENQQTDYKRIANTQKCLRVSGKHNDLEEVGLDTYHHTMFEMLGNWSFGDYFKKEAIDYAWEFLTDRLKIAGDRLYATVFEGDASASVEWDTEAYKYWEKHIPEDRILKGSKKDNFWEMGDTGPCGPCSEIHIDLRPEAERLKNPGRQLVNSGDPGVIELWNLVFIQYNRKADGKLESLPRKHVDTGLGFERLCMVMQEKTSNYDTDIFQPLIGSLSEITGNKYGSSPEADVAMRVIADHVRAIAFSISDGQIPSNNKAGYVIRRILRRAVRYGYNFLGQSEPFMYRLIPVLAEVMQSAFPEIRSQSKLIQKVIREEEASFLRTLETGIRLLEEHIEQALREGTGTIPGNSAFVLYDTYGFPFDLTELIAREKGLRVDRKGFEEGMKQQKNRSKDAAAVKTADWVELISSESTEFSGYEKLVDTIRIARYRSVQKKDSLLYHLVFDKTPFYAESGGQVGDRGYIESGGEKISVLDTQKENNLIIHIADKLPSDPSAEFKAVVDDGRRKSTALNHTATHLLHEALRSVLGLHVEQKGSLVHPEYLRFDFSHFQKVTQEELDKIEAVVNENIRRNYPIEEERSILMDEAMNKGALAFFGEKYGDRVRTVKFGNSIELCGGTHVGRTGDIGFFKIIRESSVAAGIRRIEARTGKSAEEYIRTSVEMVRKFAELFKTSDVVGALEKMMDENQQLKKDLEGFQHEMRAAVRNQLMTKIRQVGEINVIAEEIRIKSAENIRNLVYELRDQVDNLFCIVGSDIGGKAHLSLMIADALVKKYDLNANEFIKAAASEIKGGGGGQAFFATAGGRKPEGIEKALVVAVELLKSKLRE